LLPLCSLCIEVEIQASEEIIYSIEASHCLTQRQSHGFCCEVVAGTHILLAKIAQWESKTLVWVWSPACRVHHCSFDENKVELH